MFIDNAKVEIDLYPFPMSLNAKATLRLTLKAALPGDTSNLLAGGDQK